MPKEQRLVVANAAATLETRNAAGWQVLRVEPASSVPKGIYSLSDAIPVRADKPQRLSGTIVHVDAERIYQAVNQKVLVAHERRSFEALPPVGAHVQIEVAGGRARVADDRDAVLYAERTR